MMIVQRYQSIFLKRKKERYKKVTLIIMREMGTLSDAAAREEVILPSLSVKYSFLIYLQL